MKYEIVISKVGSMDLFYTLFINGIEIYKGHNIYVLYINLYKNFYKFQEPSKSLIRDICKKVGVKYERI